MTILDQRVREELVRRNYSEATIRNYLQAVGQFRRYARKRLDHLGPDDLRRYQVHLLENRKLSVGTVGLHICGLRFLYVKVLGRQDMKRQLPFPKERKRLPVILSPDEVRRLIDSARTLCQRAMLMTMYSAGLRRAELCRLKVADIDSQRMMLRVENGKGGVDREVPLSQTLLEFATLVSIAQAVDELTAEDERENLYRQEECRLGPHPVLAMTGGPSPYKSTQTWAARSGRWRTLAGRRCPRKYSHPSSCGGTSRHWLRV